MQPPNFGVTPQKLDNSAQCKGRFGSDRGLLFYGMQFTCNQM